MAARPVADVTTLLLAWRAGDESALDRLLPVVYAELRHLAHGRMRAEGPGQHTLQTTALINEAYARLVDGAQVAWQNRVHFYAVCARLMRRILVDRARARQAGKRRVDAEPIDLTRTGTVTTIDVEVLAVHEALERLAQADQRKAEVVELRYFGGLTVEETADALEVSPETVVRDWKMARLWLRRELQGLESQ